MYHFSKHFKEQMQLRGINIDEVKNIPENSQDTMIEDELTVYQRIISINEKLFLIRVFVNEEKEPPVAVTVYRTSKINKYLYS